MLKFLSIRDFVIVESLELDFSSGFTALTRAAGLSVSSVKMQASKPKSAAAMASMRPNWPPPSMPMVAPGASIQFGLSGTAAVCCAR